MQLLPERLFCGFQVWFTAALGIGRKDWRACKAKQVIFLERLYYSTVHFTKLGTVAFIEYQNHMLVKHRVVTMLFNESRQFLNGGYNNSRTGFWTQLAFQYGSAGITVGGTFLETVISES